jgi:hypothetical protein
MSLFFPSAYLTQENVTLFLTGAFSCFVIYKTVHLCFLSSLSTVSTVSSPTIMPTSLSSPISSVDSTVSSTVMPNILHVPDPSPLMVPAPLDQITPFFEELGQVFMLLMGF